MGCALCQSETNSPCPVQAFNIIQGGKATLVVRLLNDQTQDPYDLTGVTALTTCFQNDDGSELMLTLSSGISILSAVLGKIQIVLTSAQTALLRTVQLHTLELSITTTGDPIKVQIPDAYSVVQTVC